MKTLTIVIILVIIVIIFMVIMNSNKKRQEKELNDNLRYIIKSINENPELLFSLTYNDLVELEEVLSYYYYNLGKELVSNQTYDQIKNTISRKK